MTDPGSLTMKLEEIEHDLAVRQNALEAAARQWFSKIAMIERNQAIAYLKAEGGATDKRETAKATMEVEGQSARAEYEALKAVVGVLTTRGTILMAILKSQR